MDIKENSVIYIKYRFCFENREEKIFDVYIEPKTMTLIRTDREPPPAWTRMENFKCPHCPLDEEEYLYCPVAVNLKDVINFFSSTPSYERVKIYVETDDRTYFKDTAVQDGVGSIAGILMSTSGCPILGKLKSLVKFHLPFASIEETEFRAFSMYLIAQYIKMTKGKEPDWEMKGLKKVYEDIQLLNQNVAQKIADLEKRDASINAVVVLNNFADMVSFSLDEKDVSNFEELFRDLIN